MATNGFQTGGYNNDRPPSSTGSGDGDNAADPASSSFFVNDYKKHEDLKTMLDGNKDSLKLEAMKRIIGMVAKGRDASDLFPAVVKNVVSKNIEVKKLVYVYLVRYAEEQQDLALLSISTFQRALKDPNQLIRASALRVLSSIRVNMIVPIMMLAIKEAVMDMSPYVRKTAAHAIPKLYSLDAEQKDELVGVIEKLLADKTTLVAGSAIQAFEEVCPERIDLIHKNYRKLCNLLVDVEEWGQVVIINMLTRYTRKQFLNPNQQETVADEHDEKNFYADSDGSEPSSPATPAPRPKPYVMDPDHRLLLRNCKPLLNSMNASVVMAVAQLYFHCAPQSEVNVVVRALVRLLRGRREVQYIVLSNVATMSIERKGLFEPHLKSFYVRSTDPIHTKLLKLEILTNLATETNISTILREFQTYVTSSDKEFAAATIQAIGRCASSIAEVTDTCLNGLVGLLANRNEAVVGESVVVIKKLLQMQPSAHKDIIIHLAKLADSITVPMARASILWLIGEYSDRVPKIAPDVLRKMAKSFINEDDIVKLQILNLATKLSITNSKQTKLLCQYVFNLAKYDQNYDIRDRARFLRQLALPGEKGGALAKHAKKIFLAPKPAPVLESKFKDREPMQLGTLSHVINTKATGYRELPEWPVTQPDPSVRNVEVTVPEPVDRFRKKASGGRKEPVRERGFYSESESSGSEEDSSASSSDSESGSSESSGSQSESSSGSDSQSDASADAPPPRRQKDVAHDKRAAKPTLLLLSEEAVTSSSGVKESAMRPQQPPSSSDSSSSGSGSEDSSSSSEDEAPKLAAPVATKSKAKTTKTKEAAPAAKEKPSAMLLDLDDFGPSASLTPAINPMDMLVPGGPPAAKALAPAPNYDVISMTSHATPSLELLNRMAGAGLQVNYRFTRVLSVFNPKMTSVELTFTNTTDAKLDFIKMDNKKLQAGMELQEFPGMANVAPGATTSCLMGVNFNDTTQPANFDILTPGKKFPVCVSAPVGELLTPNTLSENDFTVLQSKLTGMTEASGTAAMSEEARAPKELCERVISAANVLQVPCNSSDTYRFCGKTVAAGADVLITLTLKGGKVTILVNCEKLVIGNVLVKDLKKSLSA